MSFAATSFNRAPAQRMEQQMQRFRPYGRPRLAFGRNNRRMRGGFNGNVPAGNRGDLDARCAGNRAGFVGGRTGSGRGGSADGMGAAHSSFNRGVHEQHRGAAAGTGHPYLRTSSSRGSNVLFHSDGSRPHMHLERPAFGPRRLPWSDGPLPSPENFSLMSYNVLSPALMQEHGMLYRNISDDIVSSRLSSLTQRICEANCDIICLQELEQDFYNELCPALLEYTGRFQKRTSSYPDGIGIFVRNKKFKIIESTDIFFNEAAFGNKDNVAMILQLRCRKSLRRLIVATTHLLWNPKRGDIKFSQFAALAEAIESKISSSLGQGTSDNPSLDPEYASPPNSEPTPVIITGDFNFTPDSPIYQYAVGDLKEGTRMDIRYMSGQNSRNNAYQSDQHNNPYPTPSPHSRNRRSNQTVACMKTITSPTTGKPVEMIELFDDDEQTAQPSAGPSPDDPPPNQEIVLLEAGYSFVAPPPHGLKLRSAYDPHLDERGYPMVTSWHRKGRKYIDFIFYGEKKNQGSSSQTASSTNSSQSISIASSSTDNGNANNENSNNAINEPNYIEIDDDDDDEDTDEISAITVERISPLPPIEKLRPMPNNREPSDHLPLMAQFRFVPVQKIVILS